MPWWRCPIDWTVRFSVPAKPLTFASWLDEPKPSVALMLVEPGAATGAGSLSAVRELGSPADAAVIVGPEGGWSAEESALAESRGVRLMTLGHRTLRADAVPVAAISVLQFLWGDL